MKAILTAAVIILIFLLVNERVALTAVLWYMEEKGYTLPSQKETETYTKKVWKRMLRIK